VKKKLLFITSNKWQSRVFNLLLRDLPEELYDVQVIFLRVGIDSEEIWSYVDKDRIDFIDLSSLYNFKKLSLVSSLKLFPRLRVNIKKINKGSSQETVLITYDQFYRVFELLVLSVTRRPIGFIGFQHGFRLKKKNFLNSIKSLVSNSIRYIIFFKFNSLLEGNTHGLFRKVHSLHIPFFDAENSSQNLASGNLPVASTVDALKGNFEEDSSNVLFISSGAFRTDIKEMKEQTLLAISQSIKFCSKNNYNLHAKLKDDEKETEIREMIDNDVFNIVDIRKDLVSITELLKPRLIICHGSSTAMSEFILAGFKIVSYQAVFDSYHDSYSEIHEFIKVQDINVLEKDLPVKGFSIDQEKALKKFIGLDKVNTNILKEAVKKFE